ncbi:heterokaryon incompatibility protein-domain-containing protein [Alternaria rosae]|uniref:heterokaryon incompatibility protein-domain-containing protein n=1 Tax=Alternaria rosae TaxID=1187941 RepID=UPI001E8D1685|nr:heterokaryon incompatibility protein-domain-containing protein [Alternaria rosae]KAH6872909.1 heterokaryon incompatibility protein-domain-containing protein [Alternaria rosae]
MKLDSDKKFGDLYPSIEALQIALTELETKYKETVSDTQIPLRFLTLRDSPPLEPLGNTVHLRLTQRAEYDPDWEYVAVSYTWAQPESLAAQFNTPEFKIWIDDMEARPPRCPQSVLHRALQYDIQGTKTGRLWIDQECIDQDDSIDRDEHIAHMHRIYERSKCTAVVLSQSLSLSHATLLQRCIEAHERDTREQTSNQGDQQEDCIDPVMSFNQAAMNRLVLHYRNNYLESILQEELREAGTIDSPLHAIFKRLVEDTYFTRAWTYQEQRCSKTSCYLIPILPDQPSNEVTTGRERTSIFMPSTLPPSIDRWCWRRLRSLDLSGLLTNNFRSHNRGARAPGVPVVKERGLNDVETVRDRDYVIMETVRGMNTRNCKYVSDRVTMVANICEFGITLRTTQFQDDEAVSYSTCVLALLVMNRIFKRSWASIMEMKIDVVLLTF